MPERSASPTRDSLSRINRPRTLEVRDTVTVVQVATAVDTSARHAGEKVRVKMERVLVEGIGSLPEVEVSAAQSLPLWWLSLMAVWPGPDTLMQPDLILVRPS